VFLSCVQSAYWYMYACRGEITECDLHATVSLHTWLYTYIRTHINRWSACSREAHTYKQTHGCIHIHTGGALVRREAQDVRAREGVRIGGAERGREKGTGTYLWHICMHIYLYARTHYLAMSVIFLKYGGIWKRVYPYTLGNHAHARKDMHTY
jgi:hypothetical protein